MLEEKQYWDRRYQIGDSGPGSYGDQMMKKLNYLGNLDFNSITDIGCGDFNVGSNLLKIHKADYHGFDISEVVVKRNRLLWPQYRFDVIGEEVPPADLVMCLDVLFHIYDPEDVEKTLGKLEKAWTKYLAITAYERDEDLPYHVKIRKFDYKRFGEPLIREVIEDDGELYFYLFKKQ